MAGKKAAPAKPAAKPDAPAKTEAVAKAAASTPEPDPAGDKPPPAEPPADQPKGRGAEAEGAPGIAVTTAAPRGRWRAGREFPRGATVTIALDELSDEQLAAIRADPVLTVTDVTLE